MYIFGGNHNGRYLSDLHVSKMFYIPSLYSCNFPFHSGLGHSLTPTSECFFLLKIEICFSEVLILRSLYLHWVVEYLLCLLSTANGEIDSFLVQ